MLETKLKMNADIYFKNFDPTDIKSLPSFDFLYGLYSSIYDIFYQATIKLSSKTKKEIIDIVENISSELADFFKKNKDEYKDFLIYQLEDHDYLHPELLLVHYHQACLKSAPGTLGFLFNLMFAKGKWSYEQLFAVLALCKLGEAINHLKRHEKEFENKTSASIKQDDFLNIIDNACLFIFQARDAIHYSNQIAFEAEISSEKKSKEFADFAIEHIKKQRKESAQRAANAKHFRPNQIKKLILQQFKLNEPSYCSITHAARTLYGNLSDEDKKLITPETIRKLITKESKLTQNHDN